MATAQMHRPTAQATQEATRGTIKITTDNLTASKSRNLVKRLTAMTVSTVSYLRNLFPEASFGDKRLEDINLKILKSDSQCPDSDAMVKILGQIFEAIEKDYLRKLEMGIFSDPACTPESLEESYILRFAATKDNSDGDGDGDGGDAKGSGGPSGPGKDKNGKPKWVVDLGSSTAEDTQNQAMSLLRMLIISCQGLKTLDTTRPHVVSFKLFLDDAPENFELSKFKDAAADTPMEWQKEPTKITIGGVVTEHHAMKMVLKTKPMAINDMPRGLDVDEFGNDDPDSQEIFNGDTPMTTASNANSDNSADEGVSADDASDSEPKRTPHKTRSPPGPKPASLTKLSLKKNRYRPTSLRRSTRRRALESKEAISVTNPK